VKNSGIIVIIYLPRTQIYQIMYIKGTNVAGATRLKTALKPALKTKTYIKQAKQLCEV